MRCPHRPQHTHNLVGGQHIYTYLHSHICTNAQYPHTHNDCRWDRHRWNTQLSLSHRAAVGGPALHVSHSGISVALSQSKIVFTGLSPQRSDIAASNTAADERVNPKQGRALNDTVKKLIEGVLFTTGEGLSKSQQQQKTCKVQYPGSDIWRRW